MSLFNITFGSRSKQGWVAWKKRAEKNDCWHTMATDSPEYRAGTKKAGLKGGYSLSVMSEFNRNKDLLRAYLWAYMPKGRPIRRKHRHMTLEEALEPAFSADITAIRPKSTRKTDRRDAIARICDKIAEDQPEPEPSDLYQELQNSNIYDIPDYLQVNPADAEGRGNLDFTFGPLGGIIQEGLEDENDS